MKKSKRKNGAGDETSEPKAAAPPPQSYAVPEGYEEKTSDIVGFWDYEKGPIHFIPAYAKAFDGHQEAFKPAIIVAGHAVGPNRVVTQDDEEIDCRSGDLIGVWYKPGMVRLKDLAGCKVFMQYSGEQDTGKDNPMKTFRIDVPKGSKDAPLFLKDDYRKKSKQYSIPFEPRPAPRTARPVHEDDDENFGQGPKDIPF